MVPSGVSQTTTSKHRYAASVSGELHFAFEFNSVQSASTCAEGQNARQQRTGSNNDPG